eukprot:gene5969-9968_t
MQRITKKLVEQIKPFIRKYSQKSSSSGNTGHAFDSIKKGWQFESPNIMTYNALKGSIWSISLRGLVIVNFVMFVYEYVFYPYDAKSLLTGEKVE